MAEKVINVKVKVTINNDNVDEITDEMIDDIVCDLGLYNNFNVGDFEIKMLHTPGHSKGSCSYIIGNYIFTGDTLFENTYGRTDFYDGNINEMMESLKLLQYYVNEGYILCSGHSS